MAITPAKYEWTVLYCMDESPPDRFTKEEYETLCYLGDHGFLFTCSYPNNVLNFGVRLKEGEGRLPFTNPVGKDGMYEGHIELPIVEDRIALLDAQRWAILQAYKLGLKDGKREGYTEGYAQAKNDAFPGHI